MGITSKLLGTTILASGGFIGYLAATTSITAPLPAADPIWSSKPYSEYNVHRNPSTQDVVTKRIPVGRIRPELLGELGPDALVTEFCRGVWGGWGYRVQRRYLEDRHLGPGTSSQLWTPSQLSAADYAPGARITDHFEVVEKTPSAITVRAGDTPRNASPRDSDGLFVIGARVDEEKGEVELSLKSCFFTSSKKVEGGQDRSPVGPMPQWMEIAHRWYARLWMASASGWVTR
ncbi:hypothetical protein MKZ38_009805 [Zalerion maritima]|uniref:Uncharacterized protein n=1 Tax=Zalerion maritima TaxID=339359 RepID=A0AAD5RY93_9PEZI|nr:hypothetical protein MKZ38_009805 [Zalerion maritima]